MRENGSIAPMANPMYKGTPPYTGAWADCAYDPETPGPICHPDMVRVAPDIDEVLRLYTKAVVRENPEDLIEWSRQWFAQKAAEQAAAAAAAEAPAAAEGETPADA